jgi:Circadian oscillating protein COP23
MKFLPTLLLTSTLATTIIPLATPTSAVPIVISPADKKEFNPLQISCGQAKDRSSRSTLPATVAKKPGDSENTVLIIWKSEYFGSKYNPQQRCTMVSQKIQNAYRVGRTYIASDIDKASGAGIVCGLATADEVCDRRSMLFTLKSYQNAKEATDQMSDTIQGKAGLPIYQSSSGKRFNLRDLFKKSRNK